MILKTKLIVSGVIGLATIAGLTGLLVPFKSENFNNTIAMQSRSTEQAIQAMNTAKLTITALNNKINIDQQQIKSDKKEIQGLNDQIAGVKNANDYKKMTTDQKKAVINEMLEDWGYSNLSINFVDKIFSWSENSWATKRV